MATLRALNDQERMKSKVYVWGQSGNYQIGVEPNVDGYVVEPAPLEALDGYGIKGLALGSKHTLVLTNHGLISMGCSEFGQLGRKSNTRTEFPGFVHGLQDKEFLSVSVGENHSLALTVDGVVYSWGDNLCGQLGRCKGSHDIPGVVEFPKPCKVTQISCGEYHCLALARDGTLYTWGSNKYGQLGQGSSGPCVMVPKCVTSIRSLHFVKISSGGSHSFALTVSGALFGWGRNSNGQLGLGSCDDKPFPVCCRALRQQKVRHISCGLNHTVALTKDGGVFTFGAGNHGQLGHNILNDECIPKKIFELMGSTVTQIICGRYHTLAFVPSSGKVYAFGLGAYGQLGLSDTCKKGLPCHVDGPWHIDSNSSHNYDIRLVAAGGNSCLVYAESKNGASAVDQRVLFSRQAQLDEQFISKLVSTGRSNSATSFNSPRVNPDLESTVLDVFSHPSVWNGAFLKDGNELGCSSSHHGVDLDRAKNELLRLADCPNNVIVQLMSSSVEQSLLPGLSGKIPDVEALRVFLVVPFLPMFGDPANYSTVHAPYGNALVNMDDQASKVVDKWLLHIEHRHFRYYLFTFKKTVTYIMSMGSPTTEYEVLVRQRGIQISLDVIKKLYQINETDYEERKVSYADFYIPDIAEKVDIKQDYVHWYTQQGKPGSMLYFCNYAFVFDTLAKTILLHTDAHIQMQQAIDKAHRLNLINILSATEIDPIHPCLVINVSRSNLVQDTLSSLNRHGSADLKKPLKVQFKNEEAVDEGGVRKEFFLLILREVLDVKYGMFQHYDETRLLWFNAYTFEEDMAMYHLIGLLCGLAIYNITIIDLPFPIALYKKLLGKSVNLDDLRELDPQHGKSLQDLLDYEGDDVADVFCLTFSISVNLMDHHAIQDLVPNGRNITVNNDNRQEYVNSYVSYVFNESVERMFRAFHEGFHKVCGSKVLSFFHPSELQSMVVGNEEYDWAELEKNCEYKGEFYKYHNTIQMFWEVFAELCHSQKKLFLRFLTGCDRIPIQGMKSLKMIIQPMRISEEYLPVAHTCFNLLDLPVEYSAKDKLHTKLLGAIENAEGFGLV